MSGGMAGGKADRLYEAASVALRDDVCGAFG